MRVLVILAGICAGGVLGILIGTFAACEWLWRGANLCGLIGFLFVGPLGAIAGGALADRLYSGRSADPTPFLIAAGVVMGWWTGSAAGPFLCKKIPENIVCGLLALAAPTWGAVCGGFAGRYVGRRTR